MQCHLTHPVCIYKQDPLSNHGASCLGINNFNMTLKGNQSTQLLCWMFTSMFTTLLSLSTMIFSWRCPCMPVLGMLTLPLSRDFSTTCLGTFPALWHFPATVQHAYCRSYRQDLSGGPSWATCILRWQSSTHLSFPLAWRAHKHTQNTATLFPCQAVSCFCPWHCPELNTLLLLCAGVEELLLT